MLKGINQKSKRLLESIQNSGCLFLCFAYCSPIVFEGDDGINKLNALWEKAKNAGVINRDDILMEHDTLANEYFNCNVKYDGQHRSPDLAVPENVKFLFGKFVWKFGHFVVIDREKKVVFDPLVNSASVANGRLESMRWYYGV